MLPPFTKTLNFQSMSSGSKVQYAMEYGLRSYCEKGQKNCKSFTLRTFVLDLAIQSKFCYFPPGFHESASRLYAVSYIFSGILRKQENDIYILCDQNISPHFETISIMSLATKPDRKKREYKKQAVILQSLNADVFLDNESSRVTRQLSDHKGQIL